MRNIIDRILESIPTSVEDHLPNISGMTSPKVKLFLNRLVAELPIDEGYLEVGIHMGATLIGALKGHTLVDATACDNWSKFPVTNWGPAREVLLRNIKKHESELPAIRLIEASIWDVLNNPGFKKPIGIMFYDADHTEEAQRRIVKVVYPYLAKEAVVVIDDYNRPEVRAGTMAGLKDIPYRRLESKILLGSDGYYHDLGVFWIMK